MNRDERKYLGHDERVILLLPKTRDAESIGPVLEEVGVTSIMCSGPEEVCAEIEEGAGALILAEDLISPHLVSCLRETLDHQAAWSELPIVVLLRPGPETKKVHDTLLLPGDVILVERPVRVNTLVAHVHSALRSRRRQYLVRDQMLQLEQSESRYRTLFNSIDEGFCVIRVIFDDNERAVDYVFLETNPSFEAQTGIAKAEGKSMRDIAPDHEEHWYETYGRIALSGVPARFVNEAAALGRWYDVYAFRYGEPENRQVAVLFTDITERKRWEEALRKSENKFVKIFNSAPALIGITTLEEGKIIDVNERALQFFGYQRDEVIGRTTEELALWGEETERLPLIRALQEHGSLRNVEIRFKGRSGETYTGLFSAEIIELDEVRYLLAMVQDITKRKEAELEIERLNANLAAQISELKEANQELEAFNRMVSHDLRQPLNNLALCIQTVEMLGGEMLDAGCLSYLKSGYSRIRVMNNLIDALLKFSSSTRGELQRSGVDIGEMARNVAMELRLSEPDRAATFIIAERLWAYGDPNLIRVVLENLIGNAWKYTGGRDTTVIEVGATQGGEKAFFVRDNGKGFDMAHADQLFSPFKRLPGADEFRGFGIGLATVDRIIRRHGGRIWAEAEPGKGATFYFTLPADGV